MKTSYIILVIILWPLYLISAEINIPGDYKTIQEGINAALDGDTVLVADGIYFENIDFKGKKITVASLFLKDADKEHIYTTIIDGSKAVNPDSATVVYFQGGTDTLSVLKGFTISGGKGTKFFAEELDDPTWVLIGGGIYVDIDNGARIESNVIKNNSLKGELLTAGGGICDGGPNSNGYVIISKNRVEQNTIESTNDTYAQGGAIFVGGNGIISDNVINENMVTSQNGAAIGGGVRLVHSETTGKAEVSVHNNTITHNVSVCTANEAYAGGLSCYGMKLSLKDNQITNNTISGRLTYGGGIHFGNLTSASRVENNFIADNVNTDGKAGGLYLYSSNPKFNNNVIVRNKAQNGGGLFLSTGSTINIINNTLADNEASNTGGAIYAQFSSHRILNSILWGNKAKIQNQIYITGSSVRMFYSDVEGGWTGKGNMNVDPMFANDRYYLSAKSPLAGRGIDRAYLLNRWYEAPLTDKNGNPRAMPFLTYPEMGAYESRIGADRVKSTLWVPHDFETIQEAINKAKDYDSVLVADGTYYENINFKGKPITVGSYFVVDEIKNHVSNTIIDGSKPSDPDSGSVVYMIADEDTTTVLCGFSITGGTGTIITFTEHNVTYNARVGGGIYIASGRGSRLSWNIIENNTISTPNISFGGGISAGEPPVSTFNIIENNIIRNNSVSGATGYTQGGAIFMGSNGRICNNIINENTAHSPAIAAVGGGIRLLCPDADYGARFCLIDNNTIRDNQAISETGNSFGGGVMSAGIRITLKHNQIIDNVAQGHKDYSGGGGLYIGSLLNGQHIIDSNLFSGNTLDGAYYGGGIALYNSAPRIINNILVSNSGRYGGGLFLDNSSIPEVINNTFYANIATSQGGGIYSRNSTLSIMNSIIWDNTAPSGDGVYKTNSADKIVYSDIQGGWDGEGNVNAVPVFADAENGDFHLLEGSPGIGWGLDSTIVPKTDFYGNVRPASIDSFVDMGAIESPYIKTTVPDAIEAKEDELPSVFALSQNYPNPFNPVTTIQYDLPEMSYVVLNIFNMIGQNVATLVKTTQPAGVYKISFDAGKFSSGVYVYKLETSSGFMQSRKLVIIK